jgi:hypothetical protein
MHKITYREIWILTEILRKANDAILDIKIRTEEMT